MNFSHPSIHPHLLVWPSWCLASILAQMWLRQLLGWKRSGPASPATSASPRQHHRLRPWDTVHQGWSRRPDEDTTYSKGDTILPQHSLDLRPESREGPGWGKYSLTPRIDQIQNLQKEWKACRVSAHLILEIHRICMMIQVSRPLPLYGFVYCNSLNSPLSTEANNYARE